MIDQNTVFILGAGASKPFGYPTGAELRDEIIKKFKHHLKKIIQHDDNIPYHLRTVLPNEARNFIEDFK